MKNYLNYIISFFLLLALCSGCASSPSGKIEDALAHNEIERTEKIKKYDDAMLIIKEALALLSDGNYDHAIEKLLKAREIVPIPICSYALGRAYYEKEDYETTLLYFYETIVIYNSLEWEIDRAMLQELYYYARRAEIGILRQALTEESKKMIGTSIKGTLKKEKI